MLTGRSAAIIVDCIMCLDLACKHKDSKVASHPTLTAATCESFALSSKYNSLREAIAYMGRLLS